MVKLFRLVACTLYSHVEDQGTDRTSCQKHKGNSGMMKCTGLNYSIQGQMLGFYVLGGEALVFMKEGSLLKMYLGRKVMSCRGVSGSHCSSGITILMSEVPTQQCSITSQRTRVSSATSL